MISVQNLTFLKKVEKKSAKNIYCSVLREKNELINSYTVSKKNVKHYEMHKISEYILLFQKR